ncbi:glycosyltransferase, partial [bacterium]
MNADRIQETVRSVSVIVPVHNEEDNVRALTESLSKVMPGLRLKEWELIIIDDGSSDNTFAALTELKKESGHLKVISLRRNFGQTAALAAGIDYAKFEVIVTMDGDMQNDPADIPLLLKKIEEGYDVVSGWRRRRKDRFLSRRVPSYFANLLISKVTGVKLRDYGCMLKAYRKEIIKDVQLFGDMHRFIPALISWKGVKVAEIETRHHPRKFGRTKYGLARTFKVVLDLITVKFMIRFISRPIQMFGPFGLLLMSSGFLYGLFLTGQRVFFHL